MTRRFVVVVAASLVAATALPLALALVLVREPGGSGVVTGTIWVANEGSDSLTAIDAGTHAVVTVLHGVAAPHNVQVSPDGATVWATSPSRDAVAAIDASTLAVRGIVRTGVGPAHVVLTPDGSTALVTNAGADSLAIVDVARLQAVKDVATGPYPHGLRPSPNGRSALVADMGGSTVTFVDLQTGASVAVEVGRAPVQVAFSPDGVFAYVTVNGEDAVVKIDVRRRRVVGRARVGSGPVQLAVTPDASTLVVASQGVATRPNDEVSLIDTDTMRVTAVLATGAGAHGVAIEPSGRQAFVTDVWAGDVAVIDLAAGRVVDRIPVGGEPNGVSFSPLVQSHARGAANMDSPLERTLPLGGLTGGRSGGHGHG
jgi:YVTN family beta-propeller protein